MLDDQRASLDKHQATLDAAEASYRQCVEDTNAKLEKRKEEIAAMNKEKLKDALKHRWQAISDECQSKFME